MDFFCCEKMIMADFLEFISMFRMFLTDEKVRIVLFLILFMVFIIEVLKFIARNYAKKRFPLNENYVLHKYGQPKYKVNARLKYCVKAKNRNTKFFWNMPKSYCKINIYDDFVMISFKGKCLIVNDLNNFSFTPNAFVKYHALILTDREYEIGMQVKHLFDFNSREKYNLIKNLLKGEKCLKQQ